MIIRRQPLSLLAFGILLLLLISASAGAVPLRNVLGATHAAGKYNLTEEDFLNEGANKLLEMGTRVIKVWFDPYSTPLYPFNSEWGAPPDNLADLARHPYYQELFAKPFSTFILVVAWRVPLNDFIDGMTREEIAVETQQTYDLARYLLTTYAGTGKTFILQNWEGDHLLRRGLTNEEEPSQTSVLGMAAWLNARQAGVSQARREIPARGVTVAHAVEANLLRNAMEGKVTVTNDVIPRTRADLYSYSSWDIGFDPAELVRALDYLAAKAPDSALYGSRNVYLGEYGAAKDQVIGEKERTVVIRQLTDAAVGWGARWVVYWQLYCNEPAREYQTERPTNQDLRGFWLIRPDGVKTRIYKSFQGQLGSSVNRIFFRGPGGRYVTPESGGGGSIWISDFRPSETDALILRDLNGGRLRNGDEVRILAHNGMYFREAEDGRVLADRREAGAGTTFVLRKIGASGHAVLGPSDRIAIEGSGGHYLGGGSDGLLRTIGAEPGVEGTFSIVFAE
ncbi:MAG TPA: hypothetical protein VKM72_15350 [Thermoanaerobaculia bacterium]|nr:hypothetical protein [Thermoanaerobaculia bacterium]